MTTIAAFLLALPCASQEAPAFEITPALLADAVAAARPAVEQALGYPLPADFAGARVASVGEIRRVLAAENEPILLAQLGDAELARDQARAFASALSGALLAKYAMNEHEILVSPAGFRANAEALALPELLDADVVRAVVVHELVHAADDARHGVLTRCASLGDPERVRALNAVFEGHAQHVARAVCAELGLSDALTTYGRAIVGVPVDEGDEGEALRLLRRAGREMLATTYVEGEAFVAAVAEARGADGVAAAFREPPRDMAAVLHPAWYLDPSSRPAVRFDIEAALAVFDDVYAEREWTHDRMSLDAAQLATAFSDLDEAVIARIRAAFRAGRMSRQVAPGEEAFHMTLACEWASSADAELAFEASGELLRQRDETMKEGAIRILSAAYETVRLGAAGPEGLYATKRMATPGGEFDVHSLFVRSGVLTFELLRSGGVGERAEFVALAGRIVAAAAVPASEESETPDEPDEPEDGPPEGGTSGGAGG